LKESCIRAEAEKFAKSCVSSQLQLFNKDGINLYIGNCFNEVLCDPNRTVHLRRGHPELSRYEVVLLGTGVGFQDATGVYKWDDIDPDL
jgi:hypothetical protein